MGTIVAAKIEAASRLLAAEAEYLQRCGWVPSSLRDTPGVFWHKPHVEEIRRSQEDALALQKAVDNWPNVRE